MDKRREPTLVISVHDVMPQTLPAVRRVLGCLERRGIGPVILLVVPSRVWSSEDLHLLRRRQQAGYRLAGHGWRHRLDHIRGLVPTLHSRLISRNVAEHLGLETEEILALIVRCHTWFAAHDLDPPDLYVPPAWAMGMVRRSALDALPFRYYEYLSGVYDIRTQRFQHLPLLGYEADTPWRANAVRVWNAINRRLSQRLGFGRLAIHPHDLDLLLAKDLGRLRYSPLSRPKSHEIKIDLG